MEKIVHPQKNTCHSNEINYFVLLFKIKPNIFIISVFIFHVQSSIYFYVNTPENQQLAIKEMNNYLLHGRKLMVLKGSKEQEMKTLLFSK